ncbi:hypothetical protein A0H76_2367 [Hepatospora eriocheir]|uniref:Uncharacterized protein n=1 Tax=Hepatospora eriocheir TaxID=1081669 RepID=A0A1X0QFF1_9MICR|nr:hypothetical protein A0H76_2367 [Hepatospora eriocheir]
MKKMTETDHDNKKDNGIYLEKNSFWDNVKVVNDTNPNSNSKFLENEIKPITKAQTHNQKGKQIKKAKSKIHHPDFIEFLEPYFCYLTERNIKEITFNTSKSIRLYHESEYLDNYNMLKERLCATYILNENFDFDKIPNFENELRFEENENIIKYEISSKPTINFIPPSKVQSGILKFFMDENILDELHNEGIAEIAQKYRSIVILNTGFKQKIKESLTKRVYHKAYFKLYEIIHKELFLAYNRRKSKRRRKFEEFEEEIILEHLNREIEFFEEFGPLNQFNTFEYIQDQNILSDENNILE